MSCRSWLIVAGTCFCWLLTSGCQNEKKIQAAPPSGAGLTERIHQESVQWIDQCLASSKPEELAPLAEKIVAQLMAGGRLLLAGDPGFCDEFNFRAGGLSGASIWPNESVPLTKDDVLLIGYFDDNSKATRLLLPAWIAQNRGSIANALTVRIGSARWPLIAKTTLLADPAQWPSGLYVLDTDAPATGTVVNQTQAQFRTMVMMLALEGEMISAATRQGRTLGVLASLGAPHGGAFDEVIRGKNFVDDLKYEPTAQKNLAELTQITNGKHIAPIPAGKMAREFLRVCRKEITEFQAGPGNMAQVRAGARRLADCQKRGGTIFTVCGGHLLAQGGEVPPELTRLLVYGNSFNWERPFPGIEKDDTLLYPGYLYFPKEPVQIALQAGADVVTMCTVDWPKDDRVTQIRNTWKAWDAVVEVPGYSYKALATSGLHHTLIWGSLMAEAQAMLHS